MEKEDKEIGAFLKQIDCLYGKVYSYNEKLMHESETIPYEHITDFNHIIDFYITSHAQSFVLDFYLGMLNSPGILLNGRCIIEGLALKRMYSLGEISAEQLELFKEQYRLIEFRQYAKFIELDGKIFDFKQFQIGKEKADELYRQKLSNLPPQRVKKIVDSELPFLCSPELKYAAIVENAMPNLFPIYRIYSGGIHPNSNGHYGVEEIGETFASIISLIMQEYDSLKNPENYSLTKEFQKLEKVDSLHISDKLYELTLRQIEILKKIGTVFLDKFKVNYVTNTLEKLSSLLMEFCMNKILGLCEQIKCKWKTALEILAAFRYVYTDIQSEGLRYDLLVDHTSMQWKRNLGEYFSTETGFEIYKHLYLNGADKQQFNLGYKKTTGFTINNKGIVLQLSQLVKDFAGHCVGLDNVKDSIFYKKMILDYVESQMLSHANGYMWFANYGAWADVNGILINFDMSIKYVLQIILTVYKMENEIEKNNNYKSIINVVRNGIKDWDAIIQEKQIIFNLPQMPKWKIGN